MSRTNPNATVIVVDSTPIFSTLNTYNKYIMEFLGTFFLILTIGLNMTDPVARSPLAGIAIGSVLMCMVFTGGHISGANYNPAVTFGIWLSGRGKMQGEMAVKYVTSQLAGSFFASLIFWGLTGDTFQIVNKGVTQAQAMFIELLYTFLLVFVVLNVATTKSQADNSFYGLAIGFTVLAGAITVGPLTGGVFNPAVGFGPIIVDAFNYGGKRFNVIWIYWVGPLLGGAIASVVFKILNYHTEYNFDVPEVKPVQSTYAEFDTNATGSI